MNSKEQNARQTDDRLMDLEKRIESLSIQVNGKSLVIESLLSQAERLTSRIHEIENSNAWKLAKLLVKIGSSLVPPGSRRARMFSRVVHAIRTKSRQETKSVSDSAAAPQSKRSPSKKPKIGYVIPGTDIAGGIAVVFQHTNRLLQRGYDVTLISQEDPVETPWYPGQQVQVLRLNDAGRDYDILVGTSWETAYSVAELPARRKFYFVQSDERRFFRGGAPEVLSVWNTYKMDFEFLTMARWIQTWLKDEFGKEAVYLPIGLDETVFFPAEPIAPKGERVRVLLEGNIGVPFKGMEEAFQAVNGLDCEVWCVSSNGRPKPEWKCDRFFERVPWNEMRHIYSSCDILLKMSRVESFSMPPLEMMACGGTAVVGKVTGIDEYILDRYNALVVEPGDVEGAHRALKTLIEDSEFRAQLTRNGKITAGNRNWEPTIDTLETVFTQQG